MTDSGDSSEPRWRAHLRGVLIALHLFAICLLSLPDLSGGLDRKAWKAPTVQAEFAAWSKRLSGFGVEQSPDELEDWAFAKATSWTETRNTLLVPVAPYQRLFGVKQRWRMFAAPNRVPGHLRIYVEIEGEWQLIYEARSKEHRWNARRLGQERARVSINRASWGQRTRYRKVAEWVADEVAHDFPEATRVRLCFVRAQTPSPDVVRAGTAAAGKEERALVRDLEGRR